MKKIILISPTIVFTRKDIEFYVEHYFPEIELQILNSSTDITVGELGELKDEIIITYAHPHVSGFKRSDIDILRNSLPKNCRLIVYSEVKFLSTTDAYKFICWTEADATEQLINEVREALQEVVQ